MNVAAVRPNLLFVFADQLRACSVGYAGEEPVMTPQIDRFAAEGAIFWTAVSPLPVCTPYRGSLITGRSPLATGLIINDIPLKTTEVSIAHVFNDAGYDTAYIGKWHLDGPNRPAPVPPGPRRQGFRYWMAANFEHNYDRSFYTDNAGHRAMWEGFDAEAQTSHVIDYLRRRDRSQPFCLFLSWGPPHHPYRTVPKRYLDLYDPAAIPGRPNCREVPRQDLWGYYAQTTFLDDQFARLMRAVDEFGLREDTIVVFTSDHGDMHGSHGLYKKQWPWDEAVRIPLLLRYPRIVKAGAEFRFPVSVIDVMPTLLGLAGLSIPEPVEGIDLSPFIRGDRQDPPTAALLMNPCPFSIGDPRGDDQVPTFRGMRLEYRGVRTERYTYVRTIDRPWLLYDNRNDPYQKENRIDDPAFKAVRDELESIMRTEMQRLDDGFHPKETYYAMMNIALDHRGKVADLVENPYDRLG
jgi:arylsulfatase A-like enzyme